MELLIDNIILEPSEPEMRIKDMILKDYGLDNINYRIIRKSLDARNKTRIVYRYRITADVPDSTGRTLLSNKNVSRSIKKDFPQVRKSPKQFKVLIIGSGPAGLFCALRLIEAGINVELLERGKPVEDRLKDINLLETGGTLDPESNVLFGEGGAGAYSDGKLTTRINRPETEWFYDRLIKFGADEKIRYEAKPHLGTDRLKDIIRNIRNYIRKSGSKIRFNERVVDLLIEDNRAAGVITSSGSEYRCPKIVLAAGHSARDVYSLLRNKGIALEKKDFALGVRIEHPAELIKEIQYGGSKYKNILPPAEYSLAYNNKKTGRGVYSFCMCPGGSVINSSSEENMLCVNGMSYSKRDRPYSNSAIVVTVRKTDIAGDVLAGISFQREIESASYRYGGGSFKAPAQRVTSFIKNKRDRSLPPLSYKGGAEIADINKIVPPWIADEIKNALFKFNNKMKGFITEDAVIIGAETRSSSPVRILRGGDYQSVTIKGLFPVGEGAGYAGGIVSSAVDGIKAADMIIRVYGD